MSAPAATAPVAHGHSGSTRQLLLGFSFGIVFGFLLQKGGVAKYEVLVGALRLTDFTVFKVMLSAIVVGMVGVFAMHAVGMVKLHIKPTRFVANIVGGLIFGVGFALLGYCPGTGAAAVGQGNFDALAGVAGMIAGSHLFAEVSGRMAETLQRMGDRGNLQLHEVLGIRRWSFIAAFVPLLILVLAAIERYAP